MRKKIKYNDLSEAEKASLSRTTRWRSEKRGWIFLNYHIKDYSKADTEKFNQFWNSIEKSACFVILQFQQRFEIYQKRKFNFDDLFQEIVLETWKTSGHDGFKYRSFRETVMRNRLRDLI